MEDAAELGDYLPLSFKTRSEQEYIAFLWDAFETNYTHGKYQFAFLAYHMLTMSFVYFNIWQIKQTEPSDFGKGLIGFGKEIEKSLLEATSPFVFSSVNERSILRLLKLIACDNGKIGTYAKLVDDRNDSTHPNGNIFYSEQSALDLKIREVLIHGNYLSQKDIELCAAFDISEHEMHPNFPGIESLNQSFQYQYASA